MVGQAECNTAGKVGAGGSLRAGLAPETGPAKGIVAGLMATGLLLLGGCGDSSSSSNEDGTSTPVNYNGSSTVSQPAGMKPYATTADAIRKTDLAAKYGTYYAGGVDSGDENAPADIAQESDADYANNTSGVIAASTLQSWIDDWATNKPSGITGDLVILEVADGATYNDDGTYDTGGTFINSAPGVRTYVVSRSEVHQTRHNGVMESVVMVASEAQINDFMAKYDIDPTDDMVVVAMGTGGGFQAMQMGRVWYALRYWGAPADHLALLNGGAKTVLGAGYVSDVPGALSGHYNTDDTSTPAPPQLNSPTTAAADLPEVNMALLASYEEMLNVAKGYQLPSGGAFIWDARSQTEYDGTENQERGYAFEGHVSGAKNLPYGELLDADNGYKFKDKSTIKTMVDDLGYQDGQTVYTYCVTTYRAMVTGIASGVILGYPTKFYDGAWMQWGTMAYHMNKQGTYNLPNDSPWRADIAEASRWAEYNPDATDSSTDSDVSVPPQGCGG